MSWFTLGQTQQQPLDYRLVGGLFYTFLIFNRDFGVFFWLGLFLAFWNDFSAIPALPPGVLEQLNPMAHYESFGRSLGIVLL